MKELQAVEVELRAVVVEGQVVEGEGGVEANVMIDVLPKYEISINF